MIKSKASFGGHGIVVILPEGSDALARALVTMKDGARQFAPLQLCDSWVPHVTIAAGPWLTEDAALGCAEYLAGIQTGFEATLGPTVHVDGSGEDRAAAYSEDQTLRAGWVAATAVDGNDDTFMWLHRHAMAHLQQPLHHFSPPALF
eukprot:TRINITY_DN942_c0_g1_i1.p2 TRINITY_DN942_c0_g1~~TRINITY_DN942_c0_g1_i1.p2  ORF type:complete len:147 (-),score=21.26 TRINITY_DN942_c0_g1_i1:611-1051(-)